MNDDDRAFARAIEELLDDGSDRTRSDTIDAVLLAVRTTPQERDLRIPWRTAPMSTPMRLVAAIAIGVLAAGAAFGLFRLSAGVGGTSNPSPTVTPARTLTPSPQASPTARTATWSTYVSNRYGFSIGHPADWTVRPANRAWTLGTDAMTTTTEGFIAPAQTVLVSAWSASVTPGTSAEAWIQAYCPKATSPCTGIPGRRVPVTMDGHPGSLVAFTGDVEAFILVNDRMYVVAEWRPDNDQIDLHYSSGTLLVEDFLSTMRLLQGGPSPSVSPTPS